MSSAAIRASCRGGVHEGAGTGSAEEGTGNTWDSDIVASWLSRAAMRPSENEHVTSGKLLI